MNQCSKGPSLDAPFFITNNPKIVILNLSGRSSFVQKDLILFFLSRGNDENRNASSIEELMLII